jgi:uncharacterized protein (DUF983 family)
MENPSPGLPQFATAEYATGDTKLTCAACRRPISGTYFQINGMPACAECAMKLQAQMPKDSHAAFVRAVVFGIGGALVGFALYVAFALATGLVIGFMSLAVGFLVGKAMSIGSGGVGGPRYQVVAVVLTYLAVSMSAVPIVIHQVQQHGHTVNIGKAIGRLAWLGVASPILELQDPAHGLIGLVILLVGLRFAWKFTAGRTVRVTGPHTAAPVAAT